MCKWVWYGESWLTNFLPRLKHLLCQNFNWSCSTLIFTQLPACQRQKILLLLFPLGSYLLKLKPPTVINEMTTVNISHSSCSHFCICRYAHPVWTSLNSVITHFCFLALFKKNQPKTSTLWGGEWEHGRCSVQGTIVGIHTYFPKNGLGSGIQRSYGCILFEYSD